MNFLGNLGISQSVVLSDVDSYVNMNTLFGVVVVLAILILVALIYLVNIMTYLKNNSVNKTAGSTVATPVTNTGVNAQAELVGDHELVAVITAAIYASMGGDVPADGLVVRSIRKVNR